MPTNNASGSRPKQSATAQHLGLAFIAGFLIVFVAMSLTVTMYAMHPSGGAVVECKLWQYYTIEIRRAMSPSSSTLGPGTDGFSAAAVTAFQHLLCSAVGGVGMLGVAWAIRKIRHR